MIIPDLPIKDEIDLIYNILLGKLPDKIKDYVVLTPISTLNIQIKVNKNIISVDFYDPKPQINVQLPFLKHRDGFIDKLIVDGNKEIEIIIDKLPDLTFKII